jgi:hypothetical protein
MQFLDRQSDGPSAMYFNTPAGALYLDRCSPRYIGGILVMLINRLFKFWHDLSEAFRTGQPQNEVKHGQKGMFEELYAEPGEGGKSVITCDQFMAELGDYLEGQSAVEVRQQLESHLSHCRICQVIYDSTCKTVKIVTETGSFDLPQDVSEAITEKIMAKLRPEGGKPLSKKPGS